MHENTSTKLSIKAILFTSLWSLSSAFIPYERVANKLYRTVSCINDDSNGWQQSKSHVLSAVRVWTELAEEGFVDEDENLMVGEVCLRAVKAFAGNSDDKDDSQIQDKRFLCAGALVQRPSIASGRSSQMPIYDAWMADCLMDESNLQFQGALQVLDDLFYHHLNTSNSNRPMDEILSTFVVQCGGMESEWHFASHRAVKARGFKPLACFSALEEENEESSCCWKYMDRDEEDIDALIFDVNEIDQYLKDPSSPQNIVHLLHGMSQVEKQESVFQ